jgi:hypothetical protein
MSDPRDEVTCPCVDSEDNAVENCEFCDGSGVIDQSSEDFARDDYEADMRYEERKERE